MKILTFYTDSHKELYESYFLPSYNEHLSEYELLICHYKQLSESGDYGSKGFSETMLGKIEHICDNIDLTDNRLLVFADCDIQFFSDFKEDIANELADDDIKFQNDIVCLCAGFFVCKQNEMTKLFFEQVKKLLVDNYGKYDDQQIINSLYRSHPTKIGILSPKYYTVTQTTGAKQWNGEEFDVPKCLVHHANWTVGLDNKFKLLEYVKRNR